MNKIKVWFTAFRAPFLTGTIIPIVLGTIIAWTRNSLFNPMIFLLALMGSIFVHSGANLTNDYFDFKSGNDTMNKEFVKPFTGGSRTLPTGLLTTKEVVLGSVILFTLASIIGLYLILEIGIFVLVLAAMGLFSAFFYTGQPINLASKGFGEIAIGTNFGLLMTLGAFYVQTGSLSVEPLVASIPVALLITAIVYINGFQDYVADKSVNKKNWVVRLDREKASVAYAFLMFGTYAAILIGGLFNVMPIYTFIALITVPLAVKSVQHARQFHSNPLQLVPSNALTIVVHLFTGVLLSLGYLLSASDLMSIGFLITLTLVGVCTALTFLLFHKIAYSKRPA